jgi:hypothetical protein
MARTKAFLSLKQSTFRLAKILITVIFVAHIMACVWYFSSRFDNFHVDTWVMRYRVYDDDLETKYLASVYWSITTMSTVGYGDIVAYTEFEMVLTVM